MIMSEEAFRMKIGAGKVVYIGRYSCRLLSHEYYFFAEKAEVYKNIEDLWGRAKPFLTRTIQNKGEQI